ncbi:uncharacterized protein LOC110068826 isoform X3 [Orbicella faveolata]|uniref:uncharacterized protein LOC110068826 isoform X3 n=1 Tax=Orbicella faveolata TaxID=48498 RepID=UPI0009E32DE2|nr:uncharacterized protein LOC110068826 isoform X3 [Orbicella faveolata]
MQEVFLAYRRRRRFAAEVPVTDLDDWEGYFEGMNYYEELLHMVKPESEKDRNCSGSVFLQHAMTLTSTPESEQTNIIQAD